MCGHFSRAGRTRGRTAHPLLLLLVKALLLATPASGSSGHVRTGGTKKPQAAVPKTVGWFQGPVHDLNGAGQSTFLASTAIADRIMPCCEGLTVDKNGTLYMPWGIPFNGSKYPAKETLFNLGGNADSVHGMWTRKEAFAQDVLALAEEMNVSGFTMDWEFVRDCTRTNRLYAHDYCTNAHE